MKSRKLKLQLLHQALESHHKNIRLEVINEVRTELDKEMQFYRGTHNWSGLNIARCALRKLEAKDESKDNSVDRNKACCAGERQSIHLF